MKRLKEYLPLLIDICITILAVILYATLEENQSGLVYVQIIVAPLLLFAIVLLNKTKLIRIPIVISYLLMIHLVLALVLGSAFNFYDRIACWDMILHGYFGFFFSYLVIAVLLNYKGENMSRGLVLVLVFFVTMGAAGLWEIYEFTLDTLLNGDSQRIEESIMLGLSPVYDTMMDMIIAIAGIGCCYISLGIDKLCNHRFMKYFYDDIHLDSAQK